MRYLLSRTDALGDVLISLPAMARILARDPSAEIHWLVRPGNLSLLAHVPGCAGIHAREAETDLEALMRAIQPDAVLNFSHRDPEVITAARRAGVPVRVARSRGRQVWEATHVLWRGRYGSGRHESQNVLDFLYPWGWSGGVPAMPPLHIPEPLLTAAQRELPGDGRPRLGLVLRGSGAGAFPSTAWWETAMPLLTSWGWHPMVLSPPEASPLSPVDLPGLMARMATCHAVLGPSTGPVHLAAALGVPVVCLMGLRVHHGPDRWAPLGQHVQVLQYPPPEADLAQGMDRLDPRLLEAHLARFRPSGRVGDVPEELAP